MQIRSVDVVDNDTIDLQVSNVDARTNSPAITVSEGAAGLGIPIAMYHHMHHNLST